jgi:hypothetical protein
MEVANDDFERQARNTTSSLDDLEQKYNQAIERGVMLEEEIKGIEQEREQLRVDTQRLRDELSDHRVEAEIVQEKLRLAEQTIQELHDRKSQYLSTETLRPRSPVSETSTSATAFSSPTASTPPPIKAGSSALSAAPTPPSPPLSETSATTKSAMPKTPSVTSKTKKPGPTTKDANATPRVGLYSNRSVRHSRGPSIPVVSTTSANGRSTPSVPRRNVTSAARQTQPIATAPELPRSTSLHHIRGLIGKVQKLEERVHTVRSKLPAPVSTPPRASPRNGSALGHHIPSSVTVRSNRKRASGSTTGSVTGSVDHNVESNFRGSVSRLSFGLPQRPPSALEGRTPAGSRPSSRASVTNGSNAGGGSSQFARPASRSSMSGARTPLGSHFPPGTGTAMARPRSSISGQYSHGHSGSVSTVHTATTSATKTSDDTDSNSGGFATPVARRTTLDGKGFGATGIPTPSGIPRRQSGGLTTGLRRTSSVGIGNEDMPPPPSRGGVRERRLSEVGETY